MNKKNIKISRHGTFITKVNIDKKKVIDQLKKEINKYLLEPSKNEEDVSILKDINNSLDTITSEELDFINNENSKDNKFISNQEILWLSKRSLNFWIPYIIYRYKFKVYPKLKKLQNFPPYLLIEPTSVCNLRCVMCFQVDKSFSSKKNYMGFMELKLFEKIIKDAKKNNCHAITLASRGEPTLHKQFNELLQILNNENFLDLKLNTNATMLNEDKIHQILKTNFSEIIFSVDAGTKETYEKIRVLGKFDRVVNNIKKFNQIRKEYYPNSPTVTRIAGVKVNNEQDLEQMAKFWSKHVDEVSIKNASPRWDSYNNKINNEENPCLNLWYRMYVWYDGTVNPCDFDYKSFLKMGNLNESNINQVWNSENYNILRKNHIEKNRKKHVPCDRCPITN